MTTLNMPQRTMLGKIVAFGDEGGYMNPETKTFNFLVEEGLIETNPGVTNAAGHVATRATAGGYHVYNSQGTEQAEAPATPATQEHTTMSTEFAIDSGIAVPSISRAGSATSKYPFHVLEVGQSFFVPHVTNKDGEVVPGITGSTVSSASKRYATKSGTKTITRKGEQVEVDNYVYERRFISRVVEENGVKGTRIWRAEVDNADEA